MRLIKVGGTRIEVREVDARPVAAQLPYRSGEPVGPSGTLKLRMREPDPQATAHLFTGVLMLLCVGALCLATIAQGIGDRPIDWCIGGYCLIVVAMALTILARSFGRTRVCEIGVGTEWVEVLDDRKVTRVARGDVRGCIVGSEGDSIEALVASGCVQLLSKLDKAAAHETLKHLSRWLGPTPERS